ncbi:MAG: hypothetical protein IT167_17730 [Bryobacterales bacterium]|nr:hypothetical protein [Bryobacterales bacterium]
MIRLSWWVMDIVSRVLEPDERDAVLGDFAESHESFVPALRDLLGLMLRRQVELWKDWRPWLAPVGLLAPAAVVYGKPPVGELWLAWSEVQLRTMWAYGVRYQTGMTVADDVVKWICVSLLLICWAWSGGLVVGALSGRTTWVHPCLFCTLGVLLAGMIAALRSRPLCLAGLIPSLLFLLAPFLLGVRRGCHAGMPRRGCALWLGAAIAFLTLVLQVEGGRESLAFVLWTSGSAIDERLVWAPHLQPFAVILWQFGFLIAAVRWRGRQPEDDIRETI